MVLAFPLIGNWTSWEIGNGRRVRLGLDPWVGVGEDFRLPQLVLNKLSEQRCFKLADVQIQLPNQVYRTRWKATHELQLEGVDVVCWKTYIELLESSFVSLDEDTQVKLIWTRNEIDGHYIAKKGYEVAIMEQFEGEKPWWW